MRLTWLACQFPPRGAGTPSQIKQAGGHLPAVALLPVKLDVRKHALGVFSLALASGSPGSIPLPSCAWEAPFRILGVRLRDFV